MILLSWFRKSGALALLAFFLALPAQAAFTDNGDGTVTDTVTGLIWDQCSWGLSGADCVTGAATIHTWTLALGVAVAANAMNSGVGYKSHNDWRLPSKNELESLVKIDVHTPAIDTTAFPRTENNYYWSSTDYARTLALAWHVHFGDGGSVAYDKPNEYYVRLVRGGQLFDSFDAYDTTPDPFSFTAQTGVALSTLTTSNSITVTGINSAANISIAGGEYQIGSNGWTTVAGTVNAGDTVTVRQTSSASFGTLTTATLTIGGVSGDFNVTTLAEDTTPDAFSFTAQTGVALSTLTTSNSITVTGINTASAISIVGGEYAVSTNSGATWSAWSATAPATVSLNDQVKVRQTSSASYSTLTTATLTIGGVAGAFEVTTLAAPADTTPDAFSFTAQTGIALSTLTTSNSITVTGINSAANISIAGGEYQIGSNGWTTVAGTVNAGDTVTVRQTSSASFGTLTTATLTIGGVSGAFDVTTLAQDTTPDAFSFAAQTGIALSTLTTSNSITVTGINSAANISIAGGEYQIGSNGWTTVAGTVNAGDTVTVRQTSSASFGTLTTATLTIGGVSGAFDVTTLAQDTTPDAFSFTAQTGIALSTLTTSNSITVTGINSAANISIAGGEYQIGSNGWTTVAGTVNAGDTVTVRQTSSASFGTLTTATLTIGGVSGAFDVTTLLPVTSYTAATGSGNITASFTGGDAGCGYGVNQYIPLTGHTASPPDGTAPAGFAFPHGLFDFTVSNCTPGSTITMVITYPQALSAGTVYWKYGPTPTDGSYHWYKLPAVIAGNTATFSITDGGLGDDDLTANGTIVDQGGPGNGGGAASIPTLSEWGLLALAGLMGLFGMGALRRRAVL